MKKSLFLMITCLFSFQIYAEGSPQLLIPLGLPPIEWPADNPYTPEKAELGRLLYFDTRLSGDGTIACASCHSIPKGFADPNQVSIGIYGHHGTRHAPTVINSAYLKQLFWDGRANSLEEQCKGPIANTNEMAINQVVAQAHQECSLRVKNIPGYRKMFKDVFGDEECTMDHISKAIATFERTILSGNSPYDRYMAGDKSAMTKEQINGMAVFKKSNCAICHFGFNFTEDNFQNIGIGMDKPHPDLGRYTIVNYPIFWGAFKAPTLRDVEHTAPYMHDGSLKTLEDVVDYYNVGGIKNKNLNPLIKKLNLTDEEKRELVSFMKALSGEGWQHVKMPDKFPE